MKYIKKILPELMLIAAFTTTITSCQEEDVYTPDERFVLQAYLYAGEPVTDISIRNAVPLSVADSVGEPVNDANVILRKNGVSYPLVLAGDSGNYIYPGTDLNIFAGDRFAIEATAGGRTASAETTVPEPPQGVQMSSDKVDLPEIQLNSSGFPEFGFMRQFMEMIQNVQLEVVWDNPGAELHYVVIENAEDQQESILPEIVGGTGRPGGRGSFRRITPPTRESSYPVNFAEIPYWGKYVVRVYRVNQEYASLYDNLAQDSRDLNEPPTNVKNGLGIFSAFNSVEVFFEVVKQ